MCPALRLGRRSELNWSARTAPEHQHSTHANNAHHAYTASLPLPVPFLRYNHSSYLLHNHLPLRKIDQEQTPPRPPRRAALPLRPCPMVQAVEPRPLRRRPHPVRQQRVQEDRDQDAADLEPERALQAAVVARAEPADQSEGDDAGAEDD